MKRTSLGLPVFDWKCCFICQKKRNQVIWDSHDALETVAKNITDFQNLGRLDLNWDVITEYADEYGHRTHASTLYESLIHNGARFHKACGSKYDKQKIQRLKTKLNLLEKPNPPSTPSTRLSFEKKDEASFFCVICNKTDLRENLHLRHSNNATDIWRSMAVKVGNDNLLINLSSGPKISSNLFYYHAQCNINLFNQCSKINKLQKDEEIEKKWKQAEAFDSVVNYITEQEIVDLGSTFLVRELNTMYVEKLKMFGIEETIQTTRFKERLLAAIPNLVAHTVNNASVVLFDDQVQEIITQFVQSPDGFYDALRKVVLPVRSDVLKQENEFTGSFSNFCQAESVPKTLLTLTSALIDGEMSSSDQPSQESLSVAQMIVSHTRRPTKRKAKLKKPSRRRHSKKQETPLLEYVGLKIFFTSGSRQLIDDMYHVGLSVSYDRVLELMTIFYEQMRRGYAEHGCFFSRFLRRSLFTVWLKDNIDVNPKANYNKSSYHGTSSSVIQFRLNASQGEEFPQTKCHERVVRESKKLAPLPSDYTCVKKVHPEKFRTPLFAPPSPHHESPTEFPNFNCAVSEELDWLGNCGDILTINADNVLIPGWATHHASQKRGILNQSSGINTILPLHRETVNTFNMQSHLMHLNIKWTGILNPNQTPVDVSDQPVYALTKELILRFPEEFSNYFALFGQLHIEQCILVIHG